MTVEQTGRNRARSTDDDRALLEQARDGDAGAFERVIADRLDGLWRLARALLGSDDAARDAVEVALLAAWRELPRLDDLARFEAWLDRILISECRMRLASSATAGRQSPVPVDLLAGAIARIREAPPRPPRPPEPRRRSAVISWITLALALVALVAVTAVGVNLVRSSHDPGTAVAPTAAPGDQPAASAAQPTASASDTTGSPGAPFDTDLHQGGLAVVTLEGDNLRVRSAPGVGDESKRLKPVLPAGTRMLLVGGPVEADTYTWWEVQTDSEVVDLFGWVADGKDGVGWIAPAEPRCVGDPDAAAVVGMSRIDFLACSGSTEVNFLADAASLWDVGQVAGDCGWVRRRDGCDVDNAWLLLASTVVRVTTGPGTQRDLVVAMPPDLAAQLALLPRHRTLRLTVAMDSPDARGCRVRDAQTHKLLLPHDQAVTACRLEFVVQEVAFRQ
jgi:DNA-directed RNA polymerase specialized sigma24 family protein